MYAHNVIIFSFFSCGGLGATKKSEFVQICFFSASLESYTQNPLGRSKRPCWHAKGSKDHILHVRVLEHVCLQVLWWKTPGLFAKHADRQTDRLEAFRHSHRQQGKKSEIEKVADRKTDNQADRQADRQTDRWTWRHAGKPVANHAQTHTHIHTHIHTHNHTYTPTPIIRSILLTNVSKCVWTALYIVHPISTYSGETAKDVWAAW